MRMPKKMIGALLVMCMVLSVVPMAAQAAGAESGQIILEEPIGQSTVWVDGVACEVSGGYVTIPEGMEPSGMVTYDYYVGNAGDVHTQYPVGMQVWALRENGDGTYTPEKVEVLQNIMQYSGSSIRITGKKGIRMITSIDQAKKEALAGEGLEGYKLLEYGTVLAWSSDLAGGNPLILGQEYAKSNYAYKRDEADPVFGYEGNLMQYTNVLVDFTMDECKDDVAMRSYMILEDESGKQMTVYGGIVHRSIGYIAWQNRDVFTPGTAAYNYVWEIIRHVYAVIDFEANGGSPVATAFVEKGNVPQQPADPEREGYTFAGWYQDAAFTEAFDFGSPVSDHLTLYAKWINPVTRGQWIEMLVNAYGYPHNITGNPETFADISDSQYREAIETAVVYNVLEPAPQDNFNPDAVATREFAAVTAVNAMGYTPEGTIDCIDAADISNPAAVKQAVDAGFMELEDGYFYPGRPLSLQEAEFVLGRMEENGNSSVGGDDSREPEGFVFLDHVVNKPSLDWEVRGNTMILPDGEAVPEVGTIITFGTEMAIRVESVGIENGQTVITYSIPELNEFLDYIDLEGEATLDVANFVPAEGVVVYSNTTPPISTFGWFDDQFDVPSDSMEVGLNITLEPENPVELGEGIELNYSVELEIEKVDYKFDVDFDANPFNDEPAILVKNAYVKAKNQIDAHVSIGTGLDTGDEDFDDSIFDDIGGELEIDLGSVPVVGIDGLCVEVELDLIITAEGKFELDYTVYGTVGAQVLRNEVKNITSMQSSMSLGIEASVSAGPQVGFEVEVFGEDLFAFSFGAGGKATGSVDLRSTGMVCMDGNAHVYLEVNLLEDCLIDEWLSLGVSYSIWDEDNSPFKIHGHWEDLVKVEECTFMEGEYGTIKGTVANADNRTQYIPGALVQVYDHADTDEQLLSATADRNGQYTTQIPSDTTVLLRISADGYIPFECLQTVGPEQVVYLETFLMVEGSEDSNDTGTIGGVITNAVTGSGISDITMTVYKGWNMTTGQPVDTISTDSTGRYSVTLPIGNYTILLEKDGYVSKHFNVAVTKVGNNSCGTSMNPDADSSIELGDMRIVLRWTDEPSDLDSHLWGPTADGESMFHIYFGDMSYYENGIRHAFLDIDDVNYEGPETTTVYNMTANGTYSFFIHNYTYCDYTASTSLANSGAYVEVYMGEQRIATYHVPTSGVGNVWHVFDFDAENGTITGINTFSDCSYPDMVGSPYGSYGLRSIPAPAKKAAPVTQEQTIEEATEETVAEETQMETPEETTEPVTDTAPENPSATVPEEPEKAETEPDEAA